ncbi:MAG: Na+/H+ antiporter NhaC family protein, partial [Alloprevotella sp.]
LVLYVVLGSREEVVFEAGSVVWLRVVPYLSVLLLAAGGINVLVVLLVGCLLTGGVGLLTGSYDLAGWGLHVCRGVEGMAPLITVSLLAGGLLNLVKHGGGIVYLMRLLTRRIHTRRGAEYTIAGLVSATNLCTANNTIAILSVGHLARGIAQRFGVDPRKSAGLLDTFSCCVQGLIPYGAQLMIASGLAGISPVQIIPYLYYPLLMGATALAAIHFRYPRKYSGVE